TALSRWSSFCSSSCSSFFPCSCTTIEDGMNPKINFFELPISTRDGQFTARYSEKGLAELSFPKSGRAELPLGQAARQRSPTKQNGVPTKIRAWHRMTETALKNILAGR